MRQARTLRHSIRALGSPAISLAKLFKALRRPFYKKKKKRKRKPTTKVGIGQGVTRGVGRPPRTVRPRCPAARLAAGGADSNPGPPPSPRGVPLRLRLARESQAARRPGPLRAGAARALTAESGRSLTRAGRQRVTHPSFLTRECEGERLSPA